MSTPAAAAASPTSHQGGPVYSLAHLTLGDEPTPELIRVAHQAGYDYVSPRLICGGLPGNDYTLSTNAPLYRQTKQVLAETGMQLNDIELARIAEDVDPLDYEPELAIGAELGAKTVLTSIWTEDRNYALLAFGVLADLAAKHGLRVALEFVPIAGVRTLPAAVEILRQTQRPNAGLLVDVHHFYRANTDPYALEALPREWFQTMHLCDVPAKVPADRAELTHILRAGRAYVGEGVADPAEVLRRLPPTVVRSIELPNEKELALRGPLGHAQKSLESARTTLDQSEVSHGGNYV